MKLHIKVWNVLMIVVLLAGAVFVTPAKPVQAANALRISQVYGGGASTSAMYKYDYVELFNSGTVAINLTGMSLQYGSSTGNTWSGKTNLSGTIQPGGYFLVQESGGSSGADLPVTPDLIANSTTGIISLSATNGKIALVNSTTTMPSSTCPSSDALDFVGYGTANCYEGSAPVGVLSISTAAIRNVNGCTDTDVNSADFTVATPNPRNSASAPYTCAADLAPAVSSTTPANSATGVALASDITINFSEAVNVTAPWYGISCTLSGAHTAIVTGGPTSFTLNPDADFVNDETCTVTVTAANVSDQDLIDPPDTMAADYTFSFATQTSVCGAGATPISSVQGSGATSPLTGSTVTVKGVVTGDFQSISGGFYLQSLPAEVDANPLTSEGLYIYNNTISASVGDVLYLQGTVTEYNGLTELGSVSLLNTCATGQSLPAAAVLDLPDTANPTYSLEPYEGMLVTIPETLTVQQNYFQGRYGQVTLGAGGRIPQMNNFSLGGGSLYDYTRMIVLDDGSSLQNRNPIPYYAADGALRAGDTVTGLTGVLDQGLINSTSGTVFPYNYYRLNPTAAPVFSQANPRPATAPSVGGRLLISGANVENYFTTLDMAPYRSTPPYDGSSNTPRGADSEVEFTRQQAKIVATLAGIHADVFGLTEIESWDGANGGLGAGQALVDALNAVVGAGTYAVVADPTSGYFDPTAGGDYIQTEIIYDTHTVAPVGPALSSNDTIFSRSPFAQEFRELATGETFVVVVNHFKSKGSCPASGADADQGDGQGCWNALRVQQAQALLTFINTSLVPLDPDVILVGDYNAYGAEDPINTLTAGGLVNQMAAHVPAAERYSYVFDGTSGYLDHGLSTASASAQITRAAFWHINADEPSVIDYNTEYKGGSYSPDLYTPAAYRSSDHDPVLIGLSLVPELVYVDDDWAGLANGTVVSADGMNFTIGANAFDTIQKGVNAVATGGLVHVMAGTYAENVLVNKYVHIVGVGSGAGETVVTSPASFDSRVGVFQISASGLSADLPILLQDLRVQPVGQAGISVGRFTEATGTTVRYLTLDNVFVIGTNTNPSTEQERGLYVDLTSTLDHLTVMDSAFNNLTYGWYIQKQVSADTSTLSNVVVTNTQFNHNNHKGLYTEKLTNASFTGIVVNGNGYDGSLLPSYFVPWMSGVDINLKAGNYQNIAFINATVTNNALGGAREGVGLAVKARSDGATYGAFPAVLDGVLITNSTITGNERGIRLGEPGKDNVGPTNVQIHLNRIYGNTQTYTGTDGSAYGGIVNQSLAPVNAENNWFGCNEGPAGTGGCDVVSGTVDADPWLVMNLTGVPGTLLPGAVFTMTADLTDNSAAADTSAGGTLPDGAVVNFSPAEYVDPDSDTLAMGLAQTEVTLPVIPTSFNLCTAFDAESICMPVAITQPTVTWANDDWTTQSNGDPVDVGGGEMHIFGYDAFRTIQEAVDAVTAGGTTYVLAGTYVEDVTIDKALDLLGPNAAINPNTGSRGPEAVLLPATHDPDPSSVTSHAMLYLGVDDITVRGLTIDGDNPALAGGVDAIEGIAAYDDVGQIVVENNILQNFTYAGMDFYNTSGKATSGNYIRYNLLQNIGDTTYNWGIGVLVYNNFYADVTDNVFNVVRTGIQTGNFEKANPGTTGRISNNTLNVWRLGIFHNLWYSNAGTISVDHNTINAVAYTGATKWNGILVTSFDLAANTILTDNIINIPETVTFSAPGYTAGINVWNDHTTAPLIIQGGTITGGDYGVWVNNYEGYSSNAGNTSATINGVAINGAKVGINVWDSPSNTNGATVAANLTNNSITGTETGILVSGAQASAQATGNVVNGSSYGVVITGDAALVLHDNSLSNSSFAAIQNNTASPVDASANWLGSNDAAVVAGLISGPVDYTPWFNTGTDADLTTAGFQGDYSYLNVDDGGVQTGSVARIQEAVNLVSGSTVYIWPGTYEEQVIAVDKDNLELVGHDMATTIIKSPVTLANLVGDRKPVVGIESSENVTVHNLTIDGAGRGNTNYRFFGLFYHNSSGLIDNLTVHGIRNEPLNGVQSGVAIYAYNDDSTPRMVTATHNTVFDYQKGGLTFNGIGLTAVVQDNTATGAGHTPLIAMNGIQLGFGATGTVSGNVTSGNWYTGDPNNGVAAGILLYQAANVTVENNQVSDSNMGIVATYGSENAVIRSNNVFGNDYGVEIDGSNGAVVTFNRIFNNVTEGLYSELAANAENNWWGCNEGPLDVAATPANDCDATEGLVDADPWLVLGVTSTPTSVLPGATANVAASLIFNSAAADTSAGGFVPDGILAGFTAPDGGSVLPTSAGTLNGIAGTVFTAPTTDANYQVCAAVDNETICSTITVENAAPVAVDDSYSTDEDTTLTVPAPGVLVNDTDANLDTLTAVLVDGITPDEGALTFNADGSFTYEPAANFNGVVTFTYKANDGLVDSAVATVTITVNPVNDAPVAVDDYYTMQAGQTLTVDAPGVLANDSEIDGDGRAVALLVDVEHGTLMLNGDGSFVYIPDAGWFGTDKFQYQFVTYPAPGKDPWTADAWVYITVNPYSLWLPIITR